ncbi:hypothetical protein ITJ43_03395 [Microbacterium sp. VKM Ac-2870]|uniref:DUF6907 domain-containing protein n=1 Tax=Microbacterium sp. VKM Ac-2870 TaxID=2783825 RepID=UPI00188C014A|nr:hypothetical protein [Microbacterium sp. VKM Ac-2870]MBF4561171.1 hypothetical protein [Microbacterium sp. VKM Ac-2870]
MPRERPSWLTEPCPLWCQEDHADQDHPLDRYHQSRQIFVPVVAAPRRSQEVNALSGWADGESEEIAVLALRPVGDATRMWVAIVGERYFIEVSVESAMRIHAALGEILNEVR